MHRSPLVVVLGLVVLTACKRPAAPTPADAEPPREAEAAPAIDGATAAVESRVCRPNAYAEELAKGRVAAAAGRFGDALVAFDAALVAAPFDATAHAERGYAMIRSGEPALAIEDLRFALAEAEPGLAPAIPFNLGLAYEELAKHPDAGASAHARSGSAKTQEERARAYFAAAASRGSKGAEGRLGARSRCVVARVTEGLDARPNARGWRGLHEQVEGPAEPGAPALSEADAKKIVCAPYRMGEGRDPSADACGTPRIGVPIDVPIGYLQFRGHDLLILPLPGNQFAARMTFSEGGACRHGSREHRLALRGGVVEEVSVEIETLSVNDGFRPTAQTWTEEELARGAESGCPKIVSRTNHDNHACALAEVRVTTYYDAATGKALLALESVFSDTKATATFEGGVARIAGATGCE